MLVLELLLAFSHLEARAMEQASHHSAYTTGIASTWNCGRITTNSMGSRVIVLEVLTPAAYTMLKTMPETCVFMVALSGLLVIGVFAFATQDWLSVGEAAFQIRVSQALAHERELRVILQKIATR